MNISKKFFFSAAIGTLVEYYDYALFAIFLPILAPVFFPGASAYQSLVKGYFILLIAAVARPLGGLFFGYLGDMFGRRRALLASMYGIAIATFMIGITPSFQAIGIWAVVMIVLAKAVQIFCFGGEYNGAGVYVVEHAQNKKEALMGGLLSAATLGGALVASLVGVVVTLPCMPVWGWRMGFVLGGLLAFLGIYYRKNLSESPGFKPADYNSHGFIAMVKGYPKELGAGVFIGAFITTPFTTVLTFINPVLMAKGYYTGHQLMLLQTLMSIIAIITLICAGMMADRKSPLKVMSIGCLALLVFSYPLLVLIDNGQFLGILFASILLIIINEICLGPSNAYLKNLFPMQYRYRACSLSFGIGMSIAGGLTPVIENYLYHLTGRFAAISLWLMFIGAGTLLMLRLVYQKQMLLTIKQRVVAC